MGLTPSDDELLENAIPIDEMEDDDGTEGFPVAEVMDGESAVPTMDVGPTITGQSKIRSFDDGSSKAHEDSWNRSPNTTGQGAIHVKTFYCKLRPDGIAHMDEQINLWLDAHPEYEVKFTTSSVGILVGKTKEEAMFVQVWV